MQRYFTIALVCLCFFISHRAFSNYKDFSLGLGFISEHSGLYRTETSGKRNKFEPRVMAEAQMVLDYPDYGLVIIPRAALQFPEGTEESSVSKIAGHIGVGAGMYLIDGIILQLGSSLYFTRFSAEGGTSELPNGGGTTNFPLPEEPKTVTNITADIAVEFKLTSHFAIKTQAMIFNPFNSRNKSLTYSIMFNYYFGRPI